MKEIPRGGVLSAPGFKAAAHAAGIKSSGALDMALIVSEVDAGVGAVFTTNSIKAAPVKVSMKNSRNPVRAVIMNSGNANACTGLQGLQDAKTMVAETAAVLKIKPKQVLVCSTGRIGVPLPIDKIIPGIHQLASKLSRRQGAACARAIMTTDTRPKEYAVQVEIDGKLVTIGAMAKGAGMIHPKMATMLCVVTTDAAIDRGVLRRCTFDAVERSFNRISVDGDTSTNDTVLVLANGLAGNNPLRSYHPQLFVFKEALLAVMRKLARAIVEDGEGIQHVIELRINGAANHRDARVMAEAVARSPLVKTSWAGGDPNWGRILAALGYSGARVEETLIDVYYDGLCAVCHGEATQTPTSELHKVTQKPSYTIQIDLHLGRGEYKLYCNDLTEEYVRINLGE